MAGSVLPPRLARSWEHRAPAIGRGGAGAPAARGGRGPKDPGARRHVAEVDGNRTRQAGIACLTRFEGGGRHQVAGHLRRAS